MKEYTEQRNLDTEEKLRTHIEELKRNTNVDYPLINSLITYLYLEYPSEPLEFPRLKDDVINRVDRGEKEMMKNYHSLYDNPNYLKFKSCAPQCFCDGSCKEHSRVEIPFNQPGKSFNSYTPEKLNDKTNLKEDFKKAGEKRCENIGKKEAYKETEGKLFYELDWSFITQMAERMASNKKEGKYELFNWKRSMSPEFIDSLKQATLRHLLEILDGRYEDDGRKFGHLEAISTNMMMLNYQLKLNKS